MPIVMFMVILCVVSFHGLQGPFSPYASWQITSAFFAIFGVSPLRDVSRFGSRVRKAGELQRNLEQAPEEIRPRVTRSRVFRKQHEDILSQEH